MGSVNILDPTSITDIKSLLRLIVPDRAGGPIQQCSENSSDVCYDLPGTPRHLSPHDWVETTRYPSFAIPVNDL